MTSFPLSNMKKTGNKVYVRRYRPPPSSSSSISSISDFSSSVQDGKRTKEENRQAGLKQKINICSLAGFPPNADLASWGLDPDAEKKSRKKKKKRTREKENRRGSNSPGGISPAGELGGTETLSPFSTPSGPASAAPGWAAYSMEPPLELPTSANQSGLHGLPVTEDKSSAWETETPLLHAVLIGILVLSLVGLVVLAYLMASKSTVPEKPIGETVMTLPSKYLLKAASKSRHLLQRHDAIKA
ncbi:uncharacterized protein LOC144097211 [Amblyomma americanum]